VRYGTEDARVSDYFSSPTGTRTVLVSADSGNGAPAGGVGLYLLIADRS
jgi:hypothetical protein